MNYEICACTNIGNIKQTNQDSICMKKADTPIGKIVFMGLFDGMGGLSKGEVASAALVEAFNKWFYDELPQLVTSQPQDHVLRMQWEKVIKEQSGKISAYSSRHGTKMGTTAVIMLITPKRYYIMNVGDSRAYELYDCAIQLTEDQSLVAKEVREGKITEQEALMDPRRSVLLQCVGASDNVYPEMFFGETKKGAVYMLCSDGFVHEISSEELYNGLLPGYLHNSEIMKQHAERLIELIMSRNERDNISVALVKTF